VPAPPSAGAGLIGLTLPAAPGDASRTGGGEAVPRLFPPELPGRRASRTRTGPSLPNLGPPPAGLHPQPALCLSQPALPP